MSVPFARGLVTTAWGVALSSILYIAGTLMVGRVVGAAEFGKYAVAVALANICVLPGGYGVGAATAHWVAQCGGKEMARVARLGSFTSVVATIILASIVGFVGRMAGLGTELVVTAGIYAACVAAYLVWENVLKGSRRFGALAMCRAAVALGMVAIVAMAIGMDSVSYATPLVGRGVPYAVALSFLILKATGGEKGERSRNLQAFLKYSGAAAVSAGASVFFLNLDKLVMAGMFEPAVVGNYAAHFMGSYMVAGRLSEIGTNVLLPEVSRGDAEGEISKSLKAVRWKGMVSLAAVTFCLQVIYVSILGEGYRIDWALAALFSMGVGVYAMGDLYWWYLGASGIHGMRWFAAWGCTAVIGLVLMVIILGKIMGPIGVGLSVFAVSLGSFGVACYLMTKVATNREQAGIGDMLGRI